MRFVVRDDLRRSRLTTGFRFILALPHLFWLSLWAGVMFLLLPIQWFATLFTRKPIGGLHEVYEMFVRYSLHVYAYLFLAANPFPGFLGKAGSYPVDIERIPNEEQSRLSVGFRLFLALPPFALATALGSAIITSGGSAFSASIGPAVVVGFLGWFAVLAKGRMPAGMRDLAAYCGAYAAQASAYFFLVTGKFPDSALDRVPLLPRAPHPVRMRNDDEPQRSRLTVFFRFVLALPHFVWLTLWSLAIIVVAFVAWLCGIVLGRVPDALHRFMAAFVRYSAHVTAFWSLAAGPFPGFTGKPGSYPLDVEIAPAERQSRWSIGFRWLLAFPAFMILAGLGTVQSAAAFGAWFYALWTGRMPRGLHQVLAYLVRYTAQVYAYSLLLTARYPHSGPSEEEERDEKAPELDPAPEMAFASAPEAVRQP